MQPPFSWKSFSPSTRNKNLRAGTRVLWMCFTLANVISCRLGVQKMSLCTSVQPQCTVCGLQSGKIAPNIVRADESERNQLCSTQDIWTLAVLDCSCDLYISFIAIVWDTLRCQVAFAVEKTSKCYKHHGKKCKPESQWLNDLEASSTDLRILLSEVHLKEMQRVQEAVKVLTQVTSYFDSDDEFPFYMIDHDRSLYRHAINIQRTRFQHISTDAWRRVPRDIYISVSNLSETKDVFFKIIAEVWTWEMLRPYHLVVWQWTPLTEQIYGEMDGTWHSTGHRAHSNKRVTKMSCIFYKRESVFQQNKIRLPLRWLLLWSKRAGFAP